MQLPELALQAQHLQGEADRAGECGAQAGKGAGRILATAAVAAAARGAAQAGTRRWQQAPAHPNCAGEAAGGPPRTPWWSYSPSKPLPYNKVVSSGRAHTLPTSARSDSSSALRRPASRGTGEGTSAVLIKPCWCRVVRTGSSGARPISRRGSEWRQNA